MAAHNEFGKAGEQMAAEWLEHAWISIDFPQLEICAVMKWILLPARDEVLHFIEVKSRHDDIFGQAGRLGGLEEKEGIC